MIRLSDTIVHDPFGMALSGRNWVNGGENYRNNFQGQEKDNEIWGGAISFKYRVEDPRLGRFFSVDPLTANYSSYSPYTFSQNIVIWGIELEGLEVFFTNNGTQWDAKEASRLLGIKYDSNNSDVYLLDWDYKKNEAINYENLKIAFEDMQVFAYQADHEGHESWVETYAIANTAINYLNAVNDKYNEDFTVKDLSGSTYFSSGKTKLVPDNSNSQKKAAFGAVINALHCRGEGSNWPDYSNGSIFWEGGQLAAQGNAQDKIKNLGVDFNATDLTNFKNFWNSHLTELKAWHGASIVSTDLNTAGKHTATYSKSSLYGKTGLISNGTIGSSIFFRQSDDDVNNDVLGKNGMK